MILEVNYEPVFLKNVEEEKAILCCFLTVLFSSQQTRRLELVPSNLRVNSQVILASSKSANLYTISMQQSLENKLSF